MPTYQYLCTDCGEPLEVVQSFSDPSLTTCPACEGRLRKVFSAVGVVFKGSGFYRTDSRAGSAGSAGSGGVGAGKDGSGGTGKDGSGGAGKDGGKPAKESVPAAAGSGSGSGSESGSESGKSGGSSGSSSSSGTSGGSSTAAGSTS